MNNVVPTYSQVLLMFYSTTIVRQRSSTPHYYFIFDAEFMPACQRSTIQQFANIPRYLMQLLPCVLRVPITKKIVLGRLCPGYGKNE